MKNKRWPIEAQSRPSGGNVIFHLVGGSRVPNEIISGWDHIPDEWDQVPVGSGPGGIRFGAPVLHARVLFWGLLPESYHLTSGGIYVLEHFFMGNIPRKLSSTKWRTQRTGSWSGGPTGRHCWCCTSTTYWYIIGFVECDHRRCIVFIFLAFRISTDIGWAGCRQSRKTRIRRVERTRHSACGKNNDFKLLYLWSTCHAYASLLLIS